MTERNIVTALAAHFAKHGYLCRPFLRIHPREMDLVLLDPHSLALITIEVKKTAWRGAIPQAAINRLYSHFAFIAVPRPVRSRIPRDLLQFLGLGLITFTYDTAVANIIVETPGVLSGQVNRLLRNHVYRQFRGRENALFHV